MTNATGGVPTGNTFDKYAAANPVERRMMQGFFGALDGFVRAAAPSRVVEVGAGEGEVATRVRELCPDAAISLLDLPDPELMAHWAPAGHSGTAGLAEALPFPDDCADLVLAIEVLEHVEDPRAALAEIARIASGHVVVSVPREPIWRIGNMVRLRYLGDLGNTPGHIQHWSARSFAALVGEFFDVVEVRTPLPWTMVHARVR